MASMLWTTGPLWAHVLAGVLSSAFSFWIGVRYERNIGRHKKHKKDRS